VRWRKAAKAVGVEHLTFHDLRHTGNTLAAATPGVSIKDLMSRMGHNSPSAALRYQHATQDRDATIARALSLLIRPDKAAVIPLAARRS
jgi:integrase